MSARIVFVPSISLNHFAGKKHIFEIPPINVDIRPFACRERTIVPNDHPSLYAHCQFISIRCMVELVGEKLLVA
jgi:hypothetical protein